MVRVELSGFGLSVVAVLCGRGKSVFFAPLAFPDRLDGQLDGELECRDGERDVRLFLPDKGGTSQWVYLGRGYSGEERRFQQEPSW